MLGSRRASDRASPRDSRCPRVPREARRFLRSQPNVLKWTPALGPTQDPPQPGRPAPTGRRSAEGARSLLSPSALFPAGEPETRPRPRAHGLPGACTPHPWAPVTDGRTVSSSRAGVTVPSGRRRCLIFAAHPPRPANARPQDSSRFPAPFLPAFLSFCEKCHNLKVVFLP